jgi:hypothetical protein
MTTSYLLDLREAAKKTPNVLTRKMLRDHADALREALDLFSVQPTAERLREVNGLWASAAKTLSTATTNPDQPSGTPAAARVTNRSTTQAFAKAA